MTATRTYYRQFTQCLCCLVLCIIAAGTSAEALWSLDTEFLDRSHAQTLSDARQSQGWRSFRKSDVNQGVNDRHYWLRFSIENTGPEPVVRILSAETSYLDNMHVYLQSEGGQPTAAFHFSDHEPFNTRALFYRTLATPITVPAKESIEVYVHAYQNLPDSVTLGFRLEDPPSFGARQQLEYLGFGIFYGALGIMLLMALVFGLSLGQRNALYYALFLASSVLFWLMINGLGFQYLWPEAVWWHNAGFHPVYLGFVIAALQFSKSFLQLARYYPVLNGSFSALQLIALAGIALRLAGFYAPVLVLSYSLLAVLALVIPLASWLAWRRGLDYAKWSLMAWLIYALGLIATLISASSSVLSWGMAPLVTVQVACLLETLFLMIGLAKWLVRLELDHQQALTLAHEDPLTGLGNRRRLQNAFAQIRDSQSRDSQPTYLLMIDLDYFKRINDTYGHDAGDQVLTQVGQLLRNICREDDIITRYGGEEFAILLRAPDCETATQIAERIRCEFAHNPTRYRGQDIEHTLCCGIAEVMTPHWQPSVEEMMRRADEALYQAKAAGRNQNHIYQPDRGDHKV